MFEVFFALALAAQAPQQPQPAPAPATPAPASQHQHHPEPEPQAHVHEPAAGTWHFMQDGVAFLTYNNQGGPRGDEEIVSQNWWMGMAARKAAGGDLTFSLMLSLDPLTQYGDGYAMLFQTGETWEGRPIVDRQHPHDFLMQAAVTWRREVGHGLNLTLSGAPVGEPTLGPVAFMHRKSAAENLAAPLGHHTLDSTHIAHGVIAAGLDRGPWSVEASIFRGKEPDEQRWDLMDIGPLDSWALRGWYRPSASWEFQASHGFLNEPEAIGHVDIRRTTASAAWQREGVDNWTAATAIFGHNAGSTGGGNSVWLGEATHRLGLTSFFGRLELAEVEADVLLTGQHQDDGDHHGGAGSATAWVTALTAGAARDVMTWRGYELAAGADITAYRVPGLLRAAYGDSPLSFHVFLRVRVPAPMGRMWNHVMTQPMSHGGH